MKHVWVFLLALCLTISTTACGGDNKAAGEKSQQKQSDNKQTVKQQGKTKAKSNSKGKGDQNANSFGSKGPKLQMQALAGGSEAEGRVLQPMNNYALQKKYPSILMLNSTPNEPKVALTFDDGPDRRFTPRVLDVLKKHNVKATFFLMGSRVDGLPDVTRRIADEGHAIGNHTYWHPKLWKESPERIIWEIEKTEAAIESVIGHRTNLFRPPYGGLTDEIVANLGRMNYSVIGWSVDSLDWSQIPADQVEKNVVGNVHPGSVILMHSGGHWTQDLSGMVEALDVIIPKLKKQGLEFVTIPEMLKHPDSTK